MAKIVGNYHGPLPVTPSDKKMAKKHLDSTKQLLQSKISDHQQAKQATSNPKSIAYNSSHLRSHQQDLQGVNKSLQTLSSQVNQGGTMASNNFNTQKTGSYQGKSNAAGGGGRFKQMTDHGVSPALAAYIGKKKYGSKAFSKMAAKGK